MSRYINPVPQYLDGSGNPLVDGKLFFFESGTDTLKTTYADINLSIPNTNPVILTGAGRTPNVFFTGTARVKLTDMDEAQIWDKDPVDGANGGQSFDPWVPQVIYNENDIVEGSDGNFYLSFTDGNENNDPTTSPQFWEQIEFLRTWNEFVNYAQGDIVVASDRNFYKSLIADNLNNDPISSPAEWGSPIVQDFSNPGPIGDGTPDVIFGTTITGDEFIMNSPPAQFEATLLINANVTGDGTLAIPSYVTVNFNQGGNYDGTNTFTATTAGLHSFSAGLTMDELAVANTRGIMRLVTTNNAYRLDEANYGAIFEAGSGQARLAINGTVQTFMNIGDTAHVDIAVFGGALVVDLEEGYFTGHLVVPFA